MYSETLPGIIFVVIGLAPSVLGLLKEKERTKQIEIAEQANIERKMIESQTRIKEMEILKEAVLWTATNASPKPKEIKKHNQDNLLYFENTAKKRMTQKISEPEHDADKSLPAYYDNLKEGISEDANRFDYKSMLQKILNKDDDDEA